ncbi:YigZ family protein [Mycoplasmopsis cynos]|uniref:YigZ family protein n=1 Tax=Mycoplasmopsis cynos TaxID=171284 RepID=UPI0024CD203C|nr:YigZ family protein [Mycoplasmopsis cynos]WAM08665.1 YigZ family protein [Mycoplasmopsis cynos]
MINDEFKIIVKKSTFLSYIFEISDKKEIKEIIQKLQLEHKKSRHICYSYSINKNGNQSAGFRDDGEPKNTAGRPIYEIIKIKNLNNVLVVVVRYFGGIMLGAGGLIKAYRESAKLAIENYIKNKEKIC